MYRQIALQTRVLEEEENEVAVFNSNWTDAQEKKTVFVASESFSSSKESYHSQTRINKVALLRPGDHIGWERDYPITHHAIVVKTDFEMKRILVVHNNKNGVVEEWINPASENGVLIRFDYPANITQANPSQLVIQTARSFIGEKEYHLWKNNCEHFATMCKTGKGRSAQVERIKTEAINIAVCSTITAAGIHRLSTKEKSSDFTPKTSVVREAVPAGEILNFLSENCPPVGGIGYPLVGIVAPLGQIIAPKGDVVSRMAGQMISKQNITSMALGAPWVDERSRKAMDIINSSLNRPHVAIKAEAKKATSKISKRVSIGLTVAFETIRCGYDIYQYYKQSGRKLNSQFIRNSVQRISEGVFSAALSVAGNCLAEKVGTTIGVAVGSAGGFIGSAIGGYVGACVGKVLGATVGRFLANLFW